MNPSESEARLMKQFISQAELRDKGFTLVNLGTKTVGDLPEGSHEEATFDVVDNSGKSIGRFSIGNDGKDYFLPLEPGFKV